MTQDRLNGLAILCIENDEIEDLEYDNIIDNFVSKNARKQFLKGHILSFRTAHQKNSRLALLSSGKRTSHQGGCSNSSCLCNELFLTAEDFLR
ncbi:hypothetical protein DVH24_028568 [Malus domestica]|uniref:Uncharacterized protein n=1 Tax=Malus domestica TaxID=3750 RepID=A0A498IUK0_MALDO|nr:hypothetical protein DVH24_028568 [Malus domestica]